MASIPTSPPPGSEEFLAAEELRASNFIPLEGGFSAEIGPLIGVKFHALRDSMHASINSLDFEQLEHVSTLLDHLTGMCRDDDYDSIGIPSGMPSKKR
jgi:hypothetical protein